ncbi:Hypothetical protein PBC10988_29070 [Planctomycetales bacterium 10988]|nr:Hypothetical protein PBC10988_29070 [Planctomycetales bacterium 10988]
MNASENTLSSIEECLERLNRGDKTAWEELNTHAFDRLIVQCRRIIRQKLSKPNPLITENALAAEVYQRLTSAMQKKNVQPKTAREFFGLTARHIHWQILDMLRKRTENQAEEDLLYSLTGEKNPSQDAEQNEAWLRFWTAVDGFSEEEREVFELLWINGLSQYEAAQTMGKTRNRVDSIWRRIKIKIVQSCDDLQPFLE